MGSTPGLGRFPGGGHGNPLEYSCLENSIRQGSLVGYRSWGCKESDTTEWHFHFSLSRHDKNKKWLNSEIKTLKRRAQWVGRHTGKSLSRCCLISSPAPRGWMFYDCLPPTGNPRLWEAEIFDQGTQLETRRVRVEVWVYLTFRFSPVEQSIWKV